MPIPTFNGYELNTATIIPEKIEHRTRAGRRLESEVISRRMGKKLTNTQLQEKVIQIAGTIIASSPAELQQIVDDIKRNVSDPEGSLVIEAGRTYIATAERILMPDRKYTQTLQDFEIQFVCARPYSEGSVQSATVVIPSGSASLQFTTTISGSAPNRPIFRITLPSGNGISAIVRADVQYGRTANTVTISGQYGVTDTLYLNYDRYLFTKNGINEDFIGLMDEIVAGEATFVLTVSGRNDGTKVSLEYSPRYY